MWGKARKLGPYAARKARYLLTDPAFFWMSHLARFEWARDWAERFNNHHNGFVAGGRSPLFTTAHDTETIIKILRRDGYYVGFTLAPRVVSGLLASSRHTVAYFNRDHSLPFNLDEREAWEQKLGRRLRLANHFEEQLTWPLFRGLTCDRQLLEIARGYLGCDPLFLRSEVIWSFATPATLGERRDAGQVIHCDIDGFKTLKFFFYLTDVGLENGPHQFIKKGPVRRTLKHQLLGRRCGGIPDEELVRTYAANELTTVCGPAGTGFAGDPYYFHCGLPVRAGTRVLIQMQFGCRAYRTWYYDV